MDIKKILLVILSVSSSSIALAQESIYWEPNISYTWSSGERWSFNTKLTPRQTLTNENEFDYNFNRVDLSLFASYKTFGGRSITGGYQYRLAEPFFEEDYGYEHRFTEQFSFVTYITDRRLAHVIRAEQRIRRDDYLNRLRYRLGYEFPLSGTQLDPGEKYIIANYEILYAFNNDRDSFANRFYGGLGWFFNEKRKFETGIQFRVNDIGESSSLDIHLVTSYFINQ